MSRRGSSRLKACVKCKSLVPPEVDICPTCRGAAFSSDWSGCVLVIDPEKSRVARLLNITKPGRYALKVR
ncbi:MAG: DNA-directed RNA polymerase, subunit E'' [Candidatus Nezhaarchaeota archaeon]|nr:DNA-directed RNA polymerase, subunit E'' [Candidatus Nezhaarchaeota archaeon]